MSAEPATLISCDDDDDNNALFSTACLLPLFLFVRQVPRRQRGARPDDGAAAVPTRAAGAVGGLLVHIPQDRSRAAVRQQGRGGDLPDQGDDRAGHRGLLLLPQRERGAAHPQHPVRGDERVVQGQGRLRVHRPRREDGWPDAAFVT